MRWGKPLLDDWAIVTDDALTITRLARKLGVPICKQIMQALPDTSLLDVMMDGGYLTKSNFYKQFRNDPGCARRRTEHD